MDYEFVDKVAVTISELRSFEGREVYFLIFDVNNIKIEYVSALSIMKIISYIRSHNLFSKIDIKKTMLIRGYVYLAEELPYDLDTDDIAYVIADDYDFIDFGNMDMCTEYIEEQLNTLHEDIENFAVIIGNELSTEQQHKIIKRILYNKEVRTQII